MCGIAGIAQPQECSEGISLQELELMSERMVHRGPDGDGLWVSDDHSLGFAHRRLAIIDLSDGGKQPMSSGCGRYTVTFNGEIYNYRELKKELETSYRFRSHSDTEVILASYARWGEEMLSRLNGIFSFALYDKKEKQLLLARDPFGVKPLYYAVVRKRLIFASEIKPLLVCEPSLRTLSLSGLNNFLTYRYNPAPETLFQGIQKLRPSHYALWNRAEGELSCKPYTSFPHSRRYAGESEKEATEVTRKLMKQAVERQMVSDVPVGVLLSGGVDSGVVAALASRYSDTPPAGFTVGFEEDGDFNEFQEAKESANVLGLKHHEIRIAETNFFDTLQQVVSSLEEPVGSSSTVAMYLMCREVSKSHKVVLTGQGADEPWAGYPRYIGESFRATFPFLFQVKSLQSLISLLPRNERLKRAFYALGEPDDIARFAKVYSLFNTGQRSALLRQQCKDDLSFFHYYDKEIRSLPPLQKMLYLDTRIWLSDDLLLYGDKLSMAHSLEVRVPFLDSEYIAWVESLPLSCKIPFCRKGKYLHKKAVEGVLPKELIYRKKKGFATPIDKWFQNSCSGLLEEVLFQPGSFCKTLFSEEIVRKMIQLHRNRKENHARQLYALLSLELWRREFHISLPA